MVFWKPQIKKTEIFCRLFSFVLFINLGKYIKPEPRCAFPLRCGFGLCIFENQYFRMSKS